MVSKDSDLYLRRLMGLAVAAALLYIINRLILIPMWHDTGFLRNYAGDILALPVYLPLAFYLAIKLEVISSNSQLELRHITGAVLIFSVIFEGVLPAVGDYATRDPWDIMAYVIGGLVVYLTIRVYPVKPRVD